MRRFRNRVFNTSSPALPLLASLIALGGSYSLRHFGWTLYDSIGTYPGDIWYIHMNYGALLQKPLFFNIEYPVGSFLFFKLATLLTLLISSDYPYETFLAVNSALLSMFALGATFLIWKINRVLNPRPYPAWKIYAFWIFAPSFIFYSILNYDMPAVFLTMLAVYLHLTRNDDLSAAALGLGVVAKLFPVFLLPLFLLGKKPGQMVRYCLVAGGVWLLVNLSFMLVDFKAWLFPYLWQMTREPTIDGPAYALYHLAGGAAASLFLPILYLGTLLAVIYRRSFSFLSSMPEPASPVVGFSAALLATFLLANRIFSPQYILWMLPFFVLMPTISLASFYTFEVVNVALTLFLFRFIADYPALSVALRTIRYLALILIFAQALFGSQFVRDRIAGLFRPLSSPLKRLQRSLTPMLVVRRR